MRKLFIMVTVCMIVSLPIMAQEQSRFQIFGGYSYLDAPQEFSLNSGRKPLIASNGDSGGTNHNGWNASLTVNLYKNLDFVIDTSSHYQLGDRRVDNLVGIVDDTNQLKINASSTAYTFILGPQIRMFGWKRLNPFGRALLGISKVNRKYKTENTWTGLAGQPQIQTLHGNLSDAGFAFSAGGGLDIQCSKRISWRLLQADYIRAEKQFTYDWLNINGYTPITKDRITNSFRIATGIIFNIGIRK
jgi:hypothetical protein